MAIHRSTPPGEMPSKSKKQSKSRSSKPDASLSPSASELEKDDLISCIQQASDKFPSFVIPPSHDGSGGGKSAVFVGRVSEVVYTAKSCVVWLNGASIAASKIKPLSAVSVSLLPTGNRSSGSFPLGSLIDECSGHFGVDIREEAVSDAGNYFVIATVHPHHQVPTNGARLSSNLSNSLSCPGLGARVFVSPVQIQSQRCHSTGDDNKNSLLSHICRQLYLKPLTFKRNTRCSPTNSSLEASSHTTAYQFGENEVLSTQTPSSHQSATTPRINELCLTEGLDGSPGSSAADSESTDVKEMFVPETDKESVEASAASWLIARSLLCKNIVAFTWDGKLCFFQVLHAEYLSSENTKSVGEDSDAVFIMQRKTKVSICLPSNIVSEALDEMILHCRGIDCMGGSLNINREVKKLGGLWNEYGILMGIISSPVKNALSSLGLCSPKGVLLYGLPGTGKSSLTQLCVHDAGVNFFKVNGPEVISQYYGESEQELHKVFDAASNAAPAVIFIDELDAIAPARKEGSEELSQRMVATLLNLMDGISRNEGLLIIAATNRIESVEPALRRPGRFDREIEIGVPSAEQRLDILNAHLESMEHSLLPEEIRHLAAVTHGFVGSDLAALCNEAAMVSLRRYIKQKAPHYNVCQKGTAVKSCSDSSIAVDSSCRFEDYANLESTAAGDLEQPPVFVSSSCSGEVPTENGSDIKDASLNRYILVGSEGILTVDFKDFEKAKLRARPSAMREVMLEVPRVKWEDVGGQEEVKRQLMEAVVWPQKHDDAFKRICTSPPTGVLMFGPPGCSKTLMARAVASEAGLNFLAVKGPELFNKWVGESEKAVHSLFAKARANAPSIIFFDEIDSLAVTRGRESDGISVADRVMSQLLVEMDGLHQRVNVTVIAATNRPDNIDPALLRPGRFDRLLYVGLPNEKDREDIFRIHTHKMPCSSDVDRRRLAHLTEGFTGADISLICRAAAMKALDESLDATKIKMGHFEAAIERVEPIGTEPYQNLAERFQRLISSEAKAGGLPLSPQSKRSLWSPFRWISGVIYGSLLQSSILVRKCLTRSAGSTKSSPG